METEKKTVVHEVIKSLCLDNGWSYGVFWSFHQRNSTLLTMEEAYYEEQMGFFIENMLLQVHMLGNGVIGNAAFTMKHQWIFSDNYRSDITPLLSSGTHEFSQDDDSEIHNQFSSGIETIAIISVEPYGVVQFGSSRKVLETTQFVEHTKGLFREINNCDELSLSSNKEKHIDNNSLFLPSTSNSFSTNFQNMYPFTDHGSVTEEASYNFQPNDFISYNYSPELFTDFPSSIPSTPMQSSLTTTNMFDHPESVIYNQNDIFDILGADFEFGEVDNIFADMSEPPVVNNNCDMEFNNLEMSDFGSSILTPRESLFSKLGIDQCLDGISSKSTYSLAADSSSDSRLLLSSGNNKRKRVNCSDIQSCENSFVLEPKRSEESVKVVKKRAKAGTRPKPKDRQQIQDRISELRKLIPNGIKMSIDSLLAQTIKHMHFLESVTKHAENLKKAEAPKDDDYINSWVFESEIQTMADPVDVKDLSLPGQKQIQVHSEEKGFFFEIVDIIQGFGLTILKGTIEAQEDKIRASFLVESQATKYVTKQDIYISLHQLLYEKGSKMNNNVYDQLASVNEASLLNYYQQNLLAVPNNFSDRLS